MKKLILMLLAAYISGNAVAQNAQDSAWIMEHYYKTERYIPMRDGKKLFTAIYIPKDTTEEHPVLMYRTPYGCKPYGENNFIPFWNNPMRYHMREGYILVLQDVRGRWMSEGEFLDVRPFNAHKKGKMPLYDGNHRQ